MSLEIPAEILQLIGSIRSHGNTITALSGAGVVFVVLTLFRVHGVLSDINLTHLRKPNILFIPLILFVVAFIVGHLINATLTGYFAEIASKLDFCKNAAITDAGQHFMKQYFFRLQHMGAAQLISNLVGAMALIGWVLFNRSILTN